VVICWCNNHNRHSEHSEESPSVLTTLPFAKFCNLSMIGWLINQSRNMKTILLLCTLLFQFLSISSTVAQRTPVSYRLNTKPLIISSDLDFVAQVCFPTIIRLSNPIPQNQTVDSTLYDDQRCSDLFHKGGSYANIFQFQKGYDTLKRYIEHCYFDYSAGPTFRAITNNANGLTTQGDTVWNEYRHWLRDVLYFNPDTFYYCYDLEAYAFSFVHKDDQGNLPDHRTTL